MHFTQHDLNQIQDSTLEKLSREQLIAVTLRFVDDYKKVLDLLEQQSNSRACELHKAPPQKKT